MSTTNLGWTSSGYKQRYYTPWGYKYTFTYQWTGDSWLIRIDKHPSYGHRRKDGDSTHRWTRHSEHYVCWTQSLRSFAQAEAVAHLWARSTDTYIATGVFPRAR